MIGPERFGYYDLALVGSTAPGAAGTDRFGSFDWTLAPDADPAPWRDRALLRQARAALLASGAFDVVTTTGPPEAVGQNAAAARSAFLDLLKWKMEDVGNDYADAARVRTVTFVLVLCVRNSDPDARDDELDRLQTVAALALDGRSLGGQTFPPRTFLGGGVWHRPAGAERRMECIGQFEYEVPGYQLLNTSR